MLGTAAGQVEVHGVYMGRHMGQRGRSLRSFCRRWGACVRRRMTTLLAPRFQGTHLLGRRPMPGAGEVLRGGCCCWVALWKKRYRSSRIEASGSAADTIRIPELISPGTLARAKARSPDEEKERGSPV